MKGSDDSRSIKEQEMNTYEEGKNEEYTKHPEGNDRADIWTVREEETIE